VKSMGIPLCCRHGQYVSARFDFFLALRYC